MNTNMFVLASGLSDHDLLDRIAALTGREREASAELVAHLAALDTRPSLYAAQGYGSLFNYCTRALRLSEDAACNRIDAARVCRRFPVILDGLASGALSLTTVRMLRPHLTPENHEAVLAEASGRSRQDVLELIARLAPRPDVPSSVRKLPMPQPPSSVAASAPVMTSQTVSLSVPFAPEPAILTTPSQRPVVEPTSPERYRVQFTVGKNTHDKLRRLQALLRREIPNGDPGAIFDRAVTLLLEKVEREKIGAAAKPRPIRPGTDKSRSRHTPNESKRVAWRREGGQCGFVAANGHRCTERAFIEFHHIEAFALGGPSTPDNIGLRCRRHNQYEAERVFGPRHGRSDTEATKIDRHG
jgi:hypothetical protein